MLTRILLVVMLFGVETNALQCNDSISGLTWIGYPSCDTIIDLQLEQFGSVSYDFDWPQKAQSRLYRKEVGFSQLSHLKSLKFNLTDYGGSLPESYSLLDVQQFTIQNSMYEYSGKIRAQFSTWKNIYKFELINSREGNTWGNLPPQLSKWTNLKVFRLVNHFIHRSVPIEFSAWRKIEHFQWTQDRRHSYLVSGTLPQQISEWTNIKTLDVSSNNLSGTLPRQFSTWLEVSEISLQNNNFIGVFPQEYSSWQKLSSLFIDQSKLCVQDSIMDYFDLATNNTDIDEVTICDSSPKIIDSLLAFKNSVSDPNLFGSWVGSDPCFWNRILCYKGKIHEFFIQNIDAKVQIPPQFSTLSNLTKINFGNVIVTSTLPPELSVLDIEKFEIQNHEIKGGTLPPQFSTWSNMKVFDSSAYNSSGFLTGTIPEQYSTWKRVEKFDVGNNQFFGTIPFQLSAWRRTQFLRFSDNQFFGTIPDQFSRWSDYSSKNSTALFYPQSSDNFCISTMLGTYLNKEFDISDVENLPNCFGFERNFSRDVDALFAIRDQFEQIPICGKSYKIKCFNGSVVSIYLTGSIPPEISNLRNLYKIDLKYDSVIGSLPPELSILNLVELNLNREGSLLNGVLPPEYSTWSNLQIFRLPNTRLSGRFHEQYSTWRRIEFFDVRSSQYSDILPEQYSTWQNLREFYVHGNSFSGSLPQQYSTWLNLKFFYIQENNLQGQFPEQFSVLKNLIDFRLQNNNFTGTLLEQYSNLISLETFISNNNNLSGVLPPQYSTLLNLKKFIVNNNNFAGTLPEQYSNLISLETLFSNNNYLSGTLPASYSVFTSFRLQFSVRYNNLVGTLPVQYSQLRTILFDVKNNMLSGTLPQQLSELFDYFYGKNNDISNNNFTGTIPKEYSSMYKNKDGLYQFFPQQNDNFYLIPLNDTDSCASLYLQIFIEKFSTASLKNAPECAEIFMKILEAISFIAKQRGTEVQRIRYYDTFEYQLTSDIKATIMNSSTLVNKIEQILGLDANNSSYLIESDRTAILETLIQFKNKYIQMYNISVLNSWVGDDACEWINVECYKNEIVEINFDRLFRDQNFTLTIPPEFSNLQYLDRIKILGDVVVTGTIPAELSVLGYLRNFEIVGNVSGSLPPELSTWQYLDIFSVGGGGRITGTLPKQYSMWTNLEHFEVSTNNLIGVLQPEFSTLNNLTTFDVSQNFLTGTLPTSFSKWQKLKIFNVSYNSISGTLPASFSEWVSDLAFNIGIGLKEFDFGLNKISGELPQEFSVFQFNKSRRIIVDLIMEQQLGELCILSFLRRFFPQRSVNGDVSQIRTCGIRDFEPLLVFRNQSLNQNIFDSWEGKNPCVSWFGIKCYQGRVIAINFAPQIPAQTSIPPEFSKLSKLQRIDFHDQLMTGTIPPQLSLLSDMQYFNLENHDLSGTLPPELSTWTNLKQFLLRAFDTLGILSGPLPKQYSTWQNLYRVDLAGHSLSGTLPTEFSEWDCGYVFFSSNSFNGAVPNQFSKWKRMERRGGWLKPQLGPQHNDLLHISNITYNYLQVDDLVICNNTISSEQQIVRSQADLVKQVLPRDTWGKEDDVCNGWKYIECFNGSIVSIDITGGLQLEKQYTPLYRYRKYNELPLLSIPPEFSLLKTLVTLDLGRVTGTLPPELFLLQSLENFEIAINRKANSSLPVEYSAWRNIRYFRMNNIVGQLPCEYSTWFNLRVFDVKAWQFQGRSALPVEYSTWGYKLSRLAVVLYNYKSELEGRKVEASVPAQYSTWVNLDSFVLKNTDYKNRANFSMSLNKLLLKYRSESKELFPGFYPNLQV